MAQPSSSGGQSGRSIHRWNKDEQKFLIQTINALSPKFSGFSREFCAAVADHMNKTWGKKRVKYVHLDAGKVDSKIKTLQNEYDAAIKKVFAPLLLVLCLTSLFVLLLTCTETLHPRVWASSMTILWLTCSSCNPNPHVHLQ